MPTSTTPPPPPSTTPSATVTPSGGEEGARVETGPEIEARRNEAKEHYKKAQALLSQNDLAAALTEYNESRRLYPTWSAMLGAGHCLRELRRYDESLAVIEGALRDYEPVMPKSFKNNAQQALLKLRELVGTIDITGAELDASITIDGRSRGTYPSPSPLRVPAGSHIVRVYKEGFEPFETGVDVAGTRVETVAARLRKLDVDTSGRLRVTETGDRDLDVIVDGNVVGKTPWEGPLRDGEHTVLLQGEGSLGTQPATVVVKRGRTETLGLLAEKLDAKLRVLPTPAGATVAIDSVSVGRGVWEGKLRQGKHHIEVAADGFVLYVKDASFEAGADETIAVTLDRDPTSPLWKDNRGRFFVEADVSLAIVPSFGGDIAGACDDGCSKGLGFGVQPIGRAGYRFPSGFVVGIEAGYFFARQAVRERDTYITPVGKPENPGRADDTLSLSGALIGGSGGIRLGKNHPLTFQLGAGVLIGAMRDRRTGDFLNSAGASYAVDLVQAPRITSVYIAPEVRLGFPLGKRVELSAGLGAVVWIPLTQPTWTGDATPAHIDVDGQGVFSDAILIGKSAVSLRSSLGIRYEF